MSSKWSYGIGLDMFLFFKLLFHFSIYIEVFQCYTYILNRLRINIEKGGGDGEGDFTKIIDNIGMRWVCEDEDGLFFHSQTFVLH